MKVRKNEGDFSDILNTRIMDIMNKEFIENSAYVHMKREEIELFGYTSIPTYNRASAQEQFLFINNRPVKDKVLGVALKVAYADFLARDRYPISALFLKLDPHFVDVNVHPAKTEVRFHDPNLVRSVFISAIKNALQKDGQRVSSTLGDKAIRYMTPQNSSSLFNAKIETLSGDNGPDYKINPISAEINNNSFNDNVSSNNSNFGIPIKPIQQQFSYQAAPSVKIEEPQKLEVENYPLGAAICQLHNTYIISQSDDGFIITDQHAAHERLGYEKIKDQIKKNGITRQRLLIPDIIELSSSQKADAINDNKSSLLKMGLGVEKFGEKSIIVSEIPSLLGEINSIKLINDLADHLIDLGENVALSEIIEHVTETYACHYAIRAGRSLTIIEMNEMLRQMESTDFSAQCNHGRPTYVKMKLKDIEKLFGRR